MSSAGGPGRLAGLAALTLLVAGVGSILASAPEQDLPPLSWTCRMHPDIVEGEQGACPICKMDLTPVRLDLAWACPVHAAVTERAPGACPICKRTLVRVTVVLSWTCPVHQQVRALEPGRCPEGDADLVPIRERRVHGDHNPRHGGLFFMAPDNWHHLEGVYPQPGVFRVFVYDDYTRPVGAGAFSGRAVLRESFDATRGRFEEVTAVPLVPAGDGSWLEAAVGPLALPARVTAKIRFDAGGPEHRFDFVFESHSIEPAAGQPPAAAPTASVALVVPDSVAGIVDEIAARDVRVKDLVARGAFAEVNGPALEAKDLALALEARAGELPQERREALAAAVRRLVLSAWLLDAAGDAGNGPRLAAAHTAFAAAVADLTAAADPVRRD